MNTIGSLIEIWCFTERCNNNSSLYSAYFIQLAAEVQIILIKNFEIDCGPILDIRSRFSTDLYYRVTIILILDVLIWSIVLKCW